VLQASCQGIEVHNANIHVNVAADGTVLSHGSDFVRNLGSAVNRTSPLYDAVAAAQAAAAAGSTVPVQ
jgi:hypothetical protein